MSLSFQRPKCSDRDARRVSRVNRTHGKGNTFQYCSQPMQIKSCAWLSRCNHQSNTVWVYKCISTLLNECKFHKGKKRQTACWIKWDVFEMRWDECTPNTFFVFHASFLVLLLLLPRSFSERLSYKTDQKYVFFHILFFFLFKVPVWMMVRGKCVCHTSGAGCWAWEGVKGIKEGCVLKY